MVADNKVASLNTSKTVDCKETFTATFVSGENEEEKLAGDQSVPNADLNRTVKRKDWLRRSRQAGRSMGNI